jgi:cell fate regulator YaaT (PSP1 superfamily)
MCCLRYEHQTYEAEIELTPPVDSVVKTPDGVGTVCEISPMTGMIKVKLKDADPPVPKAYHRDTVTVISRPKRGEKDDDEDAKEE